MTQKDIVDRAEDLVLAAMNTWPDPNEMPDGIAKEMLALTVALAILSDGIEAVTQAFEDEASKKNLH